MPQLLVELFSEEIPARMQGGAARDLERMATERLKAYCVSVSMFILMTPYSRVSLI